MFAVVIPAYNEQSSIAEVIRSVYKRCDMVVIVDDCSTDSTFAIASNFPVKTLRNSTNKGYEISVVTGINHAFECGCDYVLTMDADLEHSINFFHHSSWIDIVEPYQITVFSRKSVSRLSERILSIITYFAFNIYDTTSGMKLYSKAVYPFFQRFRPIRDILFFYTLAPLLFGFRIQSIPLPSPTYQRPSRYGISIKTDLALLLNFLRTFVFTLYIRYSRFNLDLFIFSKKSDKLSTLNDEL